VHSSQPNHRHMLSASVPRRRCSSRHRSVLRTALIPSLTSMSSSHRGISPAEGEIQTSSRSVCETTLRAKPKELPHKDSEEERNRITSVLEQRPKESSNGEPLGAGLQQYIYYTTCVLCEAIHEAVCCMRQ